jgi:hypothetical protein
MLKKHPANPVDGSTGIFRTRKCLKNGGARKPWMAESPKNSASAEFFINLLDTLSVSAGPGRNRRRFVTSDVIDALPPAGHNRRDSVRAWHEQEQ